MLKVIVPAGELYDEEKNLFIETNEQPLLLEHSLISVSKWESKWCKPFLTNEQKSFTESVDYVRCMTLTQNVNPEVYRFINDDVINKVSDYIEAAMTATTFSKTGQTINRDVITSELIYYWMVAQNIPFECQKWHLNRLLTLINITNIKNSPPKKMSASEIMARNTSLNEQRRLELHTKG